MPQIKTKIMWRMQSKQADSETRNFLSHSTDQIIPRMFKNVMKLHTKWIIQEALERCIEEMEEYIQEKSNNREHIEQYRVLDYFDANKETSSILHKSVILQRQ